MATELGQSPASEAPQQAALAESGRGGRQPKGCGWRKISARRQRGSKWDAEAQEQMGWAASHKEGLRGGAGTRRVLGARVWADGISPETFPLPRWRVFSR